jgi:hypothetical protein
MAGDLRRRTRRHSGMGRTARPQGRVSAVRLTCLVAGYGLAVGMLLVAGAGVRGDVSGPAPLRPDAAVEAAGLVTAWACLAWWGLAFVASVLGALPGRLGRLAAACAARIAPAAVGRVARYVLGAALVSGATVAVAVPAGAVSAPTPAPDPDPVATLAALPSLDRPALDAPDLDAGPDAPVPDRRAFAPQGPDPTAPPAETPAEPTVIPQVRPRPPAPSVHRHGTRTPRRTSAGSVVVRAGDTLWGIAARHLPAAASNARIAAEWPRWYRANADVVGTDPDLIRPGQRLRPAPSPLQQNAEETR